MFPLVGQGRLLYDVLGDEEQCTSMGNRRGVEGGGGNGVGGGGGGGGGGA